MVRRLARSLPASGSLNPWHQCSSASRMLGSQRAFCSSVPQVMIMGPICQMPLVLKMPGVRYSAITSEEMTRCMAVAPRPPYSAGQWMAAQRPSLSSRCQAARRRLVAGVDRPPDSAVASSAASFSKKGGRCSSSQARSSSRNASSSGESEKSTGVKVAEIFRYPDLPPGPAERAGARARKG